MIKGMVNGISQCALGDGLPKAIPEVFQIGFYFCCTSNAGYNGNPPTNLSMSWQFLGLSLGLWTWVNPCICHMWKGIFLQWRWVRMLQNLNGRMRDHNVQSPYCCSECDQTFTESASCKSHMRVTLVRIYIYAINVTKHFQNLETWSDTCVCLFSSFEYPWPRQLSCPSQWVSRAATRAITPENHCPGQCLFRWVNIGILICSLNQFLNRPMKGKLSDLTQRLLAGILWWVGVIK